MKNYELNDKYLIKTNTGSKGCQKKYFKDNYWYKIDSSGGEGLVESTVSKLLSCSTLPKWLYVFYEKCFINNKSGCRSKSFLNDGEVFISFKELYTYYSKGDLSNDIWVYDNAVKRAEFLRSIVMSVARIDINKYLKTIMLLDMLIENRDRHLGNLGVILDRVQNTFVLCPIFDNGASLGVGLCTGEKSTSCTISGSFVEQVLAFGYPIKTTFKLNYEKIYREINVGMFPVLERNLKEYENIFRR